MASGATFDAEANNVTLINGSTALAPWYVNGTVYSGAGLSQTLGNVTLGSGTLNGGATGSFGNGNYSAVGGSVTTITSSGNSLINAPAGLSLQGSNALSINVVNPGDVLTIAAGIFNAYLATNPGITKSGSGTLVLAGNSSYSGSTTISGGVLAATASGALGSSDVLVASGGTLLLSANTDVLANAVPLLTIQGGLVTTTANGVSHQTTQSVVFDGGGTLASGAGGANDGYGNYNQNGNVSVINPGATTAVIGAGTFTLYLNPTTFTVARGTSPSDLTVSSDVSGNGCTLTGGGIMTLTGSNTYTGATTISAGTLLIGGSGALGGGNYAGGISNSGALVVNTSSNQTFSGAISGAGGLTQAGPGTLTLAQANTYSGPTTVSGATLTTYKAIPNTSSVTVASGATFDAEVNNATYNTPPAPWYVNGTVYSGAGFVQTLGNVTLGGGTLSGNAAGGGGFGNYGNYTITGGAYSITSSGNSLISALNGLSLQGSGALGIDVVNPGDVLTISASVYDAPGGYRRRHPLWQRPARAFRQQHLYRRNDNFRRHAATRRRRRQQRQSGRQHHEQRRLDVCESQCPDLHRHDQRRRRLDQDGARRSDVPSRDEHLQRRDDGLDRNADHLQTDSEHVLRHGGQRRHVRRRSQQRDLQHAPRAWYVNGTAYSGAGFVQTLGNVTLGGGTLSGNAAGGGGFGNYGNYTITGGDYSITSSGNSLISALNGLSIQGS